MKLIKSFVCLFALFCLADSIVSQSQTDIDNLTQGKEQRLKWMKEARFGMFIHWGTYSYLAGEWNGKQIPSLGEWIMYNAKIPVKEYEQMARNFNPVKFNADEWVSIAEQAGMKYLVITSKHCDGFAMYPSKVTNYNIYDWTAFKHDPLKELKNSCVKRNIKLGFYYSHCWDWHEPDARGLDNTWDFPDRDNKQPDLYYMNKSYPQVNELLVNYQPDMIWFDVPTDITLAQSFTFLKMIREKLPGCIINDRIGNELGDYATPEQYIPSFEEDFFEVCMTLNDTWGYKYWDHKWKSIGIVIRNLADIVSKGGNYLLNVGPTSEGLIPEPSIRILQETGLWMKQNGESIYGTTASPFSPFAFDGRCTQKPGKLYIHIFEWPVHGCIIIPAIENDVEKIYLLADQEEIPMKFSRSTRKDIIIDLLAIKFQASLLNQWNNVLVIEYKGILKILDDRKIIDPGYTSIFLPSSGKVGGPGLKYKINNLWNEDRGYHTTGWHSTDDSISWDFRTIREGLYEVLIEYGAVSGCEDNTVLLRIDDSVLSFPVIVTDSWYKFRTFSIGKVQLDGDIESQLIIKAGKLSDCSLMNLKSISLIPVH